MSVVVLENTKRYQFYGWPFWLCLVLNGAEKSQFGPDDKCDNYLLDAGKPLIFRIYPSSLKLGELHEEVWLLVEL